MTPPTPAQIHRVTAATWPAARDWQAHGFTLRDGAGGGNRVSAATLAQPLANADIPAAATAMQAAGQQPLFMVRAGEDALDAALAGAGYVQRDATRIYAAPAADIATERPPPVSAFTIWPPLAVQKELWATGGIGPARLAVMDNAPQPKTTFLARRNDRPAGCVFAGIHDGIAMLHALDIAPDHRRAGLARHLTRAVAYWALDHDAPWLTLLATRANRAAHALYTSLGMQVVGQYHYRIAPEDKPS